MSWMIFENYIILINVSNITLEVFLLEDIDKTKTWWW